MTYKIAVKTVSGIAFLINVIAPIFKLFSLSSAINEIECRNAVSYTHLTLPTTPYV